MFYDIVVHVSIYNTSKYNPIFFAPHLTQSINLNTIFNLLPELISDPKTIINYVIDSNDEAILKKIGLAIKSYLVSKGYEALVLIVESSEYKEEQGIMLGSIITNAKLFHNGITDG